MTKELIVKKKILIVLVLFLGNYINVTSQTTKQELLSNQLYLGGLYTPYIYTESKLTNAPAGYSPFYLSHYGRHGSRWIISATTHSIPLEIFNTALTENKLTKLGESVFERLKLIVKDAEDRYGDLSQLGVKEHREIAERMFKNYPEIFNKKSGEKCVINSQSTQVPRCILSMAANNERLKELNPQIETFRDATKKNTYLNNEAKINKDTVKVIVSSYLQKHFKSDRFVNSLFNDTTFTRKAIKDPAYFSYLMFSTIINLPNLDHLKLNMNDIFTKDELFILSQVSNMQMYFEVGPSPVNGSAALKSAGKLLMNILDLADSAINKNYVSADLRFGHDSYIIPLLALMHIKGMDLQEANPEKIYLAWSSYKVSPMGTNLQIVFYKNEKNDVLVKLLHCEKEVEIPVRTDMAPFYHWRDVREYYEKIVANCN